MGESIYKVWPILDINKAPFKGYYTKETLWLTANPRFNNSREPVRWRGILDYYNELAQQALVPNGYGYPKEWDKWRDIYSPRLSSYRKSLRRGLSRIIYPVFESSKWIFAAELDYAETFDVWVTAGKKAKMREI